MKKLWIIMAVTALLIPSMAMAGVFQAEKNVTSTETITENLYLTGSAPVMSGTVEGDLYIAGGNVVVTGNVTEDLVAAGGNITISASIGGDVRVFGGTVFIDGPVNGEVVTSGGEIRIGPNAQIQGDLTAMGGLVEIDPQAQITGTQLVKSGEGEKKESPKKTFLERLSSGAFWTGNLLAILTFFLVATIFLGLFPNVLKKWSTKGLSKGQFWKSVGLGFLLLIVTPITVLLLLITGVGALLGGILLIIYIAAILLNIVFAGIFFGEYLKKWFTKSKKTEATWTWGLGGIAALHIVSLIPFIGWIICFAFFLFSWGTIASVQWNIARTLK